MACARHYVALHGLRSEDMERNELGFEEVAAE
jgi:hypothetical protein